MLEKELENALGIIIKQAGSEPKLSKLTGVTQAHINNLKNGLRTGTSNIDEIKLGTLRKLFPDMKIDFLGGGGQKKDIATIIKMLNRLSDEEQHEIMLAIVAKYPHAVEKTF